MGLEDPGRAGRDSRRGKAKGLGDVQEGEIRGQRLWERENGSQREESGTQKGRREPEEGRGCRKGRRSEKERKGSELDGMRAAKASHQRDPI
jgi:hypothetical protein